ncbi:hypothetical protein [Sphingomonas sp.]|uniref:hypothetical protein n=1 Tax=Sphingomonas sp. TaxID=28214 RepID=UPI002E364900|nr:hypothetical protein [Sphingomonas sp.]HEX4693561.1 hypothetical protein [Sphingomonas sp.]
MRQRFVSAVSCLALLSVPTPSLADDTKTVGIAAGIGVTAASGKNSVSDGGGAVEAGVLNVQGVLVAGAEIRRLALQLVGTRQVLVVGHSDTIDFAAARYFAWRLKALEAYTAEQCTDKPGKVATKGKSTPAPSPDPGERTFSLILNTPEGRAVLSPSDAVAAIATDIDVKGIPLSVDDRMLVNSILMGTASAPRWYQPGELNMKEIERKADNASGGSDQFIAPGDLGDIATDGVLTNRFLARFDALSDWAGKNTECKSLKDKVAAIKAFVAAGLAADKGPAPIMAAAELNTILTGNPDVLRVAIEQDGGLAVTRSNIWYSLGYPGAVKVSAGLIVSFRLTDPRLAAPILTGVIRCVVKSTSLRDVKHLIETTTPLPDQKVEAAADTQALVGALAGKADTPAPMSRLTKEQLARQLVSCSVAATSPPT